MKQNILKGFQKKHLRGLAHKLSPVVNIGKKGVSDTLLKSLDEALNSHELIKIKFIDFKEKNQKKSMIHMIEERTGCELVGIIGHTAILFRRHSDPEKQKVVLK